MNAASNAPQEALLNEAQAANHLNVSVRTLQQWRVSGRGPLFTKLSRAVRYRRADLDAYVARGVAQSTTQADANKNVA
ncbi:MAG TPA: helix-turn-helix domain-containing protein [Methylocystis sp.]|jgi:predicted site-specific integrase-resolvase